MIEQHGVPDECHVSKIFQGSPVGPSHHGTKHEEREREDQKRKTQNQESSEPKWICA